MKVGIIAPIKSLEKYCITNIQYCLPTLLLKELSYRDFYSSRKKKGDYIIMDCRTPSWRREPVPLKDVEKALSLVYPNIIIAPSKTFKKVESFKLYKEFKKAFQAQGPITIRCIEGVSTKDLEDQLTGLLVAIPSYIYRFLPETLNSKTIFLDNHKSLEELDKRNGILVTSLPVRLGMQGRLMSDFLPSPPSLTFYEEEDRYQRITERNIGETIDYYGT